MSPSTSVGNYLELGKVYLNNKQPEYAKALSAFTSAIEAARTSAIKQSDAPTISLCELYDRRAECHEKLADFTAALKDGRKAYQLNPRDARGYLRTGSVLQMRNKLDKALDVYKLGMKEVPVNNAGFTSLQKAHDILTRKLSRPQSVDPFTVLPVELIELILAYLPFKNIVSSLRVSKGWQRYITRSPKLWRNLDLSEARKPVSRDFMSKAVNYAEREVARIVVHKFYHTDMLKRIATVCMGLREVEVLSLPMMHSIKFVEIAQRATALKKLVVRTDITIETVARILQHRPTLEHVEFSEIDCRSLRNPVWKGPFLHLHSVTLNADVNQERKLLRGDALTQQAPNLRHLSLTNWRTYQTIEGVVEPYPYSAPPAFLTSLELKRVDMHTFPPLPCTLQRLVLHPTRLLKLPTNASQLTHIQQPNGMIRAVPAWHHALTSHVPHLTHLVLSEMQDLNPTFLQVLLDRYKGPDEPDEAIRPTGENGGAPLQYISLSGVLHRDVSPALFSDAGLLAASPRILTPALESLRVAGLPCTDNDIEELVTARTPVAASLRTVDVSATKISGSSLRMLADGAPQLAHIKADNCRNVSSRDAVAYVQGKGIGVSCRMNDEVGGRGGKKVRYG